MTRDRTRTTIDIPSLLYRRLKAHAAREGSSVRQVILRSVEKTLIAPASHEALAEFPLLRSRGAKIAVDSERIYRHVEFP